MKHILLLCLITTSAMAAALTRPNQENINLESEEIAAQEFACGNSILCYFPEATARQALGSYLDQNGIENRFQIRGGHLPERSSLAWRTFVAAMGQYANGCLPHEVHMERSGSIYVTGMICDRKTFRAGKSKRFQKLVEDITPHFRHVDHRRGGGIYLSMNVKYKK